MNLSTLTCPRCNSSLDNIKAVTPGTVPEVGDGFVCPCGFIGEFADGHVQEILPEELTVDERSDVSFAKRVLGYNGE